MSKNIVLTGFMGAGKSVLSRQLAKGLNRKAVSTDKVIVRQEGRPITDIFRDSGEAYFRKVESDVVANVSKEQNIIIDCGGGVVLDPDNMANLKETGIVFYLAANPEVIYERIKKQRHRPLLHVDDPKAEIAKLLDKRKIFYEKADYIIDTNDDNWERVGAKIIAIMESVVKG